MCVFAESIADRSEDIESCGHSVSFVKICVGDINCVNQMRAFT